MKIYILSLAFVLLTIIGVSGQRSDDTPLIFFGKVEKMGDVIPRDSGGHVVYQLIKLRIGKICEGSYKGSQIIVDFIKLEPNDLKDFGLGDWVFVNTSRAKSIDVRYDSPGIRKPSDIVDDFYIGTSIRHQKSCN